MDKPNEFRTNGFYMEEGDVLRVTMIYEDGSDLLDVELVGDGVEANPTAPLVDLDGNAYTSVIIGSQEWIVENFRCTKYADGSSIPVVTSDAGWIADAAGAMCYYDNDKATYESDYGALYNWYAVDNVSGLAYLERNGVQDSGWRVATLDDLTGLIAIAGGDPYASPRLRKDGAGIWIQTPNTATNDYGFGVMPAGKRSATTGVFDEAGIAGWFHSSTPEPSPATVYNVSFFFFSVIDDTRISNGLEGWGFSIRLVRDV
jgi:uncharacterized protein (TIGR02145 family)